MTNAVDLLFGRLARVDNPGACLSSSPPGPTANRLLAGLPQNVRQRLAAQSETVSLSLGEVLAQPGEALAWVYFPLDSYISLITSADGRPCLEVGLAGTEGMLGASFVLDVNRTPTQAVVQGAGPALRLSSEIFREELAASSELQGMLKHYLYVVIAQLGQTAACTRYHRVEARLARWLLMTHDRVHEDTFTITHEFLGYILGVRRAGISEAANEFQSRALISYKRGEVTVLDRQGLERTACDCYFADRETYRQILS